MEFRIIDNIVIAMLCLLAISLSVSIGILMVASNEEVQYFNIPQHKLENTCALEGSS